MTFYFRRGNENNAAIPPGKPGRALLAKLFPHVRCHLAGALEVLVVSFLPDFRFRFVVHGV
jgi:hypothetical protein